MVRILEQPRDKNQRPSAGKVVEEVVGCKWTLAILGNIRKGISRPGAIERSLPGLTTKVMNERLRKLVRLGVLERIPFAEVPPRVEYRLTEFGQRLGRILDEIERLDQDQALR